MKKQLYLCVLSVTVLSGCVSSSEFDAVQSQVLTLHQKVGALSRELVRVEEELNLVKGQRVVRLPTGAPTDTEARRSTPPAYALSPEEKAFQAAESQYQSGDAQGAVTEFSQFIQQYPNAKQRDRALFYLGQSAYTIRDYARARTALETLVYQPSGGQTEAKAVDLLQKVYTAEGNTAGMARLAEYIQALNTAPAASSVNAVPAGSIIEAPAEPLRPSTL